MSRSSSSALPPPLVDEHLLGRYSCGVPGPTVLIMGGIHGNEPAGVHALRRVIAILRDEALPLRGEMVAIAGNLAALNRGERFLRRDLNRQWLPAQVEALRRRDPALDDDEDRQQRGLLDVFEQCVAAARGPVAFADLHTSSADGPPFVCLGDTLVNRDISLALGIPVILGLEETIDGAVLEFFNERGLAGIAIEGGQHRRPETIDSLEAAIWLVLVATGALPERALGERLYRSREVLRRASGRVPHVVEIRRHHRISRSDEFVMRPGYVSFQSVHRGETLAEDRSGAIRADQDGRVLLPLYQGLGEDGFFLVRDVRPFWLGVARWMRRVRFGRLLPLLPGVRRHPTQPDALLVDPRVARWLVREVFHLLGYRHCRPEGELLVFRRREIAAGTELLPWRG